MLENIIHLLDVSYVSTSLEVTVWGRRNNVIYLTNKEASTVLCSVVKHLGSGYSTKEV